MATSHSRFVLRLALLLLAPALVCALLTPFAPFAPGHPLPGGLSPEGAPLPPGGRHFLGTDSLGRDLFSRLLAGAGGALWVGGVSTAVGLFLGLLAGLTAALAGGMVDLALVSLANWFLAFPFLLLMMLLAALFSPSGFWLPFLIGAFGWPSLARVLRAEALRLLTGDDVLYAQSAGAGPLYILRRHLLPDLFGPAAALAAPTAGGAIALSSALAYLGLGDPGAANWGNLLREGQAYLAVAPWLFWAPALLLGSTVLGFTLLGDALRLEGQRQGA